MQDRAKGNMSLTFLCPLKWCSSLKYTISCTVPIAQVRQDTYLISRRHRFVKIRYRDDSTDENRFTRNSQRACLGVDVGDFFDRTPFTRFPVSRCNDAAVGTLTELLDEVVLGVDKKCRIERGEAMSLYRLHRGRQ
jgi:hypothetical protein